MKRSMKIVILDGYSVNPGDMSWDALSAFGEVTVYTRTAPFEIVERCAGSRDGAYQQGAF